MAHRVDDQTEFPAILQAQKYHGTMSQWFSTFLGFFSNLVGVFVQPYLAWWSQTVTKIPVDTLL